MASTPKKASGSAVAAANLVALAVSDLAAEGADPKALTQEARRVAGTVASLKPALDRESAFQDACAIVEMAFPPKNLGEEVAQSLASIFDMGGGMCAAPGCKNAAWRKGIFMCAKIREDDYLRKWAKVPGCGSDECVALINATINRHIGLPFEYYCPGVTPSYTPTKYATEDDCATTLDGEQLRAALALLKHRDPDRFETSKKRAAPAEGFEADKKARE